jgi:hypothetical protein
MSIFSYLANLFKGLFTSKKCSDCDSQNEMADAIDRRIDEELNRKKEAARTALAGAYSELSEERTAVLIESFGSGVMKKKPAKKAKKAAKKKPVKKVVAKTVGPKKKPKK